MYILPRLQTTSREENKSKVFDIEIQADFHLILIMVTSIKTFGNDGPIKDSVTLLSE